MLSIEGWGSLTSTNYVRWSCKVTEPKWVVEKTGPGPVKCRKTGPGPVIVQEIFFCVYRHAAVVARAASLTQF
jgi:hypothetical protein